MSNIQKKKKMKIKNTTVLMMIFAIVFVFSLISGVISYARTFPLEIENINISNKSNDVSEEITSSSKGDVNSSISFHKLYGFVTYDFKIKSNLDEDITILSITDNNENEYIEYEYDNHENDKLESKTAFHFIVKEVYKNELNDITKRNQSSSVTFTIKYLDSKGNKEEIIINPQTGNRIGINIVLLIISGVGILICSIINKEKNNKKIVKISMLMITSFTLTPFIVKATMCSYNILLKVNNNILDKVVITIVESGEEKQIIANYGDMVSGLESPSKEGYTFEKWIYEDGSDFDPTKPLTEDIKLVAKLTPNRYTIDYDLNGGATSTNNPTTYSITEKIELEEPTKEYYIFIGWTGTDLIEPTKNVIIENKTGNRSYQANYIPRNYSIIYNGLSEEELNQLNNPTSYNVETTPFNLTNPADRIDLEEDKISTFAGWKENQTISTTITLPNLNSMGNKTFEAQWTPATENTHSITYTLNGGTTETANLVEFTKNTETFTLTNPTKEGYTFKGWSGTNLTGDENLEVKVIKGTRENLAFEAHYTPNEYQIVFNKNGSNVMGTMNNQELTYDVPQNLSDISYVREGYTFNSWNTRADGSGTAYDNKAEVNNLTTIQNSTVNLYAQWSPNSYTIKFNSNENSAEGSMEDLNMIYDIAKTLPLNTYSVLGYSFDSWNTRADGTGTKITNGEEVNNLAVNGIVNLYAKWIAKTDTTYKVEYYQENVDNDEYSLYETEYETGTTDTDASATIKTYENFTYDSNNTKNKITGNIERDGSLTLKVYYKRNTHTVEFNSNGGSIVNSIEKKHGAKLLFAELSQPTKIPAEFLGWYTESEAGTLIEEDMIINEDTILYAHWTTPPICRRATSLHIDTCARTDNGGCKKVGYSQTGKYKSTTIVYGNTSGENLASGDAFDCDVNGDGIYNPTNERFYYIKTKNDKAVMVFSSNFEGEDGVKTTSNYEYDEALTKLPTMEQWPNVATEYDNYAARILKVDEVVTACGVQPGSTKLLTSCDYILENTSFKVDNLSIVRSGIWVEKYNNNYYRLHSFALKFVSVENTSKNVVRPVIDVPISRIDNTPITEYTISFDSQGGSFTESPNSDILNKKVNDGGVIRLLPTPKKENMDFEGWYIDTDYTEKISQPLIVNANKTYYAKWSYTPEHTEFNIINEPMREYYNNISIWKNNEMDFQTNMDNNFNAYSCQSCDATSSKPYQSCPINKEAAKKQCDRPNGFDTNIEGNINVYLSDEVTKEKGAKVNYVTVTDGIIYNMIPGKTYYWESENNPNIYGTVKALGERRIIDAGAVRNVRDLGGMKVDTDGDGTIDGTLKYEKMYRGVRLDTTADITSLEKLGITEEIDLRGSESDPKLLNYVPLSITNYEIDPENFLGNYKNLRNAINRTMDDVINGQNVFFHCKIGTDRTGTIAYFLEGLLGVTEEERLQDYELSYFYGLLNRHRFYSYQPGSSITHRFTYMHDLYPTNESIYNFYMSGAIDSSRDADIQRITDFRNAMINYN